jgi:hypothetical protein
MDISTRKASHMSHSAVHVTAFQGPFRSRRAASRLSSASISRFQRRTMSLLSLSLTSLSALPAAAILEDDAHFKP